MRLAALALVLTLVAAGCVDRATPAAEEETVLPAADPTPAPEAEPTAEPTPSSPPPASPSPASPAAKEPAAAPPASVGPRIEVASWVGTFTGGGASPPAGPVCCAWRAVAGENTDASFDVAAGLTGIVVELVSTHEQFDLDLQVLGADYVEAIPPNPDGSTHTGHVWSVTTGLPGQPETLSRLEITDAEALALVGTWVWRVGAKGPAVEAPFTMYVSLVRDAAPPSGYSAVPAA